MYTYRLLPQMMLHKPQLSHAWALRVHVCVGQRELLFGQNAALPWVLHGHCDVRWSTFGSVDKIVQAGTSAQSLCLAYDNCAARCGYLMHTCFRQVLALQ
jgi:hypothetical protein